MAGEDITGIFDFSGGVNQAIKPNKIGANQLAGLVNGTLENGVRPRLKFHHRPFTVLTEGGITGDNGFFRSYQSILAQAKFQLFADYVTDQDTYLLVMKAGILFRLDIDDRTAIVINTPDTEIVFNEYQHRYNWSYSGRFFTIFDHPNHPILVEDETIRRASGDIVIEVEDETGSIILIPSSEVPPSCLGTYNQNRLAVASPFNEFVIGDPVATGFPDAPISFSEVFVANAPRVDQFFSVGNRPLNEAITFMGNLNITDTSTGIGPLIVSTSEEVWAYRTDLPLPRSDQPVQGFGSLLISNHGIIGPRAAANVGFDFIYVSSHRDVRSLNTSRQQQPTWSNTSISEEVKEYLETNYPDLMQNAVVEYFENRVFITVNPYRVAVEDSCKNTIYDIAFNGLIVLETAIFSGLAGTSPPVWAGLWQGINPMEMKQVKGRFFIISKDRKNTDRIYEMVDSPHDLVDGVKRTVKTRIYTKSLGTKHPQVDKKIVNIQAIFNSVDIHSGVTVSSYFKPRQASQYTKLQTVSWSTKESAKCTLNRVKSGLKEMNLGGQGDFIDKCDKTTKRNLSIWRSGQIMLELEGDWDLDSIQLRHSLDKSSGTPEFNCDNIAEELQTRDCEFLSDWDFYSVKPTLKLLEQACQDKDQV